MCRKTDTANHTIGPPPRPSTTTNTSRLIPSGQRTTKTPAHLPVRCSPTCLLPELLSWLTKSLYQTVCVRGAGDDLLYRADEQADQVWELRHRFSGRWIWETRDIMILLLEQSVEFSLQPGKPSNKELRSTPKFDIRLHGGLASLESS